MLCGRCNKSEAEVFLKQIVNNQVTQYFLCRACAQDKGLLPSAPNLFGNLLAGLGVLLQEQGAPTGRAAALKCAVCGMRYGQFMETGRLGCAQCYTAFREPLEGLLRSIHGSTRHAGRTPRAANAAVAKPAPLGAKPLHGPAKPAAPAADELERLRSALRSAVARENFEEAARLRDRIRALEA